MYLLLTLFLSALILTCAVCYFDYLRMKKYVISIWWDRFMGSLVFVWVAVLLAFTVDVVYTAITAALGLF